MNLFNYKYCLFIFLFVFPLNLLGQKQKLSNLQDTTQNKALQKDTLFIDNKIKSDQFYDSLIVKASKNRFTKTALDLLLVNNPSSGNFIGIENTNNEEYYKYYSGKIIRNIEIIKLDVFGPTLKDTTNKATRWFQKFGNNTHVSTRKHIVRNNLLFNSGDTIDPHSIIDNERILRELEFLKDASIQIVEIPGSEKYVDVLIITKDVYSAGIYFDITSPTSAVAEAYESNIAGIGHRLYGKLHIDYEEDPIYGYEFNYKTDNLGGSFLKLRLKYLKVFETEQYGIELKRNFFSYNTKWAGAFSVFQTSTITDIKKTEGVLTNVRLNYTSQDIWLGRSFLLKTNNWQYQDRTRLVIASRYIKNTFYKGPFVSERYNFQFHDNQIAIGGIAFSRQKYFKSSLIYGFGKTEDIPIGDLFQVNSGLEKDEFYKRVYVGLKYSKGTYYTKIGYLNFHSEFGGLYYQKNLEQGVIKFKTQAISNLHSFNKLKLREFLSINYTRGINRFSDEKVYINSNNIWGLSSDLLFGLQRISFNAELVAYSNINVYNFRFLFFGFGDLGFIGPENRSLFNNKLYSGVGLGVRVRNENLVFKTFLIRFAFYPRVPSDAQELYFVISGENYKKPVNFEPTAPATIEFK